MKITKLLFKRHITNWNFIYANIALFPDTQPLPVAIASWAAESFAVSREMAIFVVNY